MIINHTDLREEVHKLDTDFYELGIAIAANDDLDDYVTPGVYYSANMSISGSLANCPYTSANFKLLVMYPGAKAANYIIQVIVTTSQYNRIFTRSCHNGSWSTWERLVDASEIAYSTNDTFTASSITIDGLITNNIKRLRLSIPVAKSMGGITGVSVTTLTGVLIGAKGYLDSNSSNVDLLSSAYTVTVTKSSDNIVSLTIDRSTAFTNVDNNTPIAFIGNVTLKFT